MPDGSEFQTAGAATLKPREATVVRTQGTDNRLVLNRAQRTCSSLVIHKGVAVSRLSEAVLWVSVHGKFEEQMLIKITN